MSYYPLFQKSKVLEVAFVLFVIIATIGIIYFKGLNNFYNYVTNKSVSKETMVTSMDVTNYTLYIKPYISDPSFGFFDANFGLKDTVYYKHVDGNTIYSLNTIDVFLINPMGNNITNNLNSSTITIIPLALPSATNFINVISYVYYILNDIGNQYPNNTSAGKAINANADFFKQYNFTKTQVYFNDPAIITYQPDGPSIIDANQISDNLMLQYIDIQNQVLTVVGQNMISILLSLPKSDYSEILQILRNMSNLGYYPGKSPITMVKSYQVQQKQSAAAAATAAINAQSNNVTPANNASISSKPSVTNAVTTPMTSAPISITTTPYNIIVIPATTSAVIPATTSAVIPAVIPTTTPAVIPAVIPTTTPAVIPATTYKPVTSVINSIVTPDPATFDNDPLVTSNTRVFSQNLLNIPTTTPNPNLLVTSYSPSNLNTNSITTTYSPYSQQ